MCAAARHGSRTWYNIRGPQSPDVTYPAHSDAFTARRQATERAKVTFNNACMRRVGPRVRPSAPAVLDDPLARSFVRPHLPFAPLDRSYVQLGEWFAQLAESFTRHTVPCSWLAECLATLHQPCTSLAQAFSSIAKQCCCCDLACSTLDQGERQRDGASANPIRLPSHPVWGRTGHREH